MLALMKESQVLAIKDEESQLAIPTVWRPVIKEVISAFVRHDYQLNTSVHGVTPVSLETADQIRNYILAYGEELSELPDETWASSVCIWMGDRWDALIDLWTLSEGRSDLVLSLKVTEGDDGFEFSIYMVYVP
ncbi:hypothetical protein [Undibacterium sp.]|uniref:DUF7668 domain-containing protein n=1 Tax=Undibacterium sp. TaxID=1914977 RepID=UPI0037531372